ncbi:hypothetical protein TrVE_jg13723 [Triparma verrucosa]|uniref:Centriolar satellite-associated tubulin polyglutamylase complex regulator 1 n=1 Tax=Triparma verrucosa TaxID=1606542 RepID=A0A9W7BDD0_9STRA|nr:hypothetical protein TrVE_jg13723 [Triparma verrucosa]
MTPPRKLPSTTQNTPAKKSAVYLGLAGNLESLRMMPNSSPGRHGNAQLENLPNGTYLSQSKVQVYLASAISTLIKVASATPPPPTVNGLVVPHPTSVHSRPLHFLSTYFDNVLHPKVNHTSCKPFTYIVSTPYNRQTFLLSLHSSTQNFHSLTLTPDDFHSILLLLSPDFSRGLTHTCAWLSNGGRASASTSPLPFPKLLKTFTFFFTYLDFFLQVLTFFVAAYDGASSSKPQSIIMPPLLCSNSHSPLKELSNVYGTSSWRRSFGCSVDSSHVLTALTRIESGCVEAGLPSIDSKKWRKGMENKGKVTLERLWKNLEG